jgi:ribosome recycling factor
MGIENIFKELSESAKKIIDKFVEEAAVFRITRPNPALVENIQVECYGTKLSLKEIASISVQLPNSIVIQPWDISNLQAIERAILKSELNLSPVVDKNLLRIELPPVSEERRKELVRLLNKKGEDTRIKLRLLRDEIKKKINQLASSKEISEDEKFKSFEKLQKEIDSFQERLDNIIKEREKEILTI